MNEDQKDRYITIRLRCKTGRGEATAKEVEFLQRCRKNYPDECVTLDEEVNHQAHASVNPMYQRPE